MSKNKIAEKPAQTTDGASKGTPEKLPRLIKVRVLRDGLIIGGSTAARGAELAVPEADAAYFEKRGEVTPLGIFVRK